MRPSGGRSLLLDGDDHLERLALELGGADYRHEPGTLGCARSPGEGGYTAVRHEQRGWSLALARQFRHPNLALRACACPHGENNLRTWHDRGWRVNRKGNRQRRHHGC